MAAHCDGHMVAETRLEPLSYLLMTGLPELTLEAHHELECEHADIPYSPDWEAYQRMENEGGLRFFSLREGQNLIGYASVIIDTDLHRDGLLIAHFRDIFLTKKKRGYAARFVKYIERVLRTLGVQREYASERLLSDNNAGRFFKAVGFQPQEIVWGKTLH